MSLETKEPVRRRSPRRVWRKKCIACLTAARRGLRRLAGSVARLGRGVRGLMTGRQGNRFPESEYGAVQLLLLVRGCLPALGATVRERVLRRHKRSARSGARVRGRLEEFTLHPVAFLLGAMAIAAAAVALSLYTVGTAVSYDGTDLGVVSGRKTVEQVVNTVEVTTRRTLAEADYQIDRALLASRRRLVARKDLEGKAQLEQRLTDALGKIDYGYVLYVDDEPVAATPFAGAMEELLEQMKIGYVTASTVECYFVESVDVRQEFVDRSYVMNLGYIAEKLNATKSGEVTYTVVAGDTYYGIAELYDLTLEQLLAMNPGYDATSLHVGDVLTVSQAVPYLTVVDVERQSYVQDVPYGIEYHDDPDMYQGDYEVISAGVYGKADITANVTYINGEETGRQVAASATLTRPVDEVRRRGTKERPSWFPTGVFHWPCNGVITSYFGGRDTGIYGASTYHEGLDIANGYGTVICASDGGTVVHSGWYGGLGYLVIIDHGNGYKTYYGHNSSLIAEVGDHVYQGQPIAYMGSTGVSSGSHCHFGVMLNGTFVNPLNYLG